VEKYGRTGQASDNIIRRMHISCWITNARIETHARNIEHLLHFHGNIGYANAP
jgi:hypothetical protein